MSRMPQHGWYEGADGVRRYWTGQEWIEAPEGPVRPSAVHEHTGPRVLDLLVGAAFVAAALTINAAWENAGADDDAGALPEETRVALDAAWDSMVDAEVASGGAGGGSVADRRREASARLCARAREDDAVGPWLVRDLLDHRVLVDPGAWTEHAVRDAQVFVGERCGLDVRVRTAAELGIELPRSPAG